MKNIDLRQFWQDELAQLDPVIQGDCVRSHSPFTGKHKSKPFVAKLTEPVWIDHSSESEKKGGHVYSYLMRRYSYTYHQAVKHLSVYGYDSATNSCRPPTQKIILSRPPQAAIEEFRFREVIKDGLFNRSDVSRFVESLKTPDYYGHPTATECYYSLFLHASGIINYAKTNQGSIRGYTGPVHIDWLPFDVDFGNNLEAAREISVKLYEKLLTNAVPRRDIIIFFSGNKGFHLQFRHPILDDLSRYPNTPKQVQKIVREFTASVTADTNNQYTDEKSKPHQIIDDGIYGCSKLIRSPNTRHGKTGLYKIPLTEHELQFQSIDDIRFLALIQRKLDINQ